MTGLRVGNNLRFTAASDELYTLVINISTGLVAFDEIVEWLRNNTQA